MNGCETKREIIVLKLGGSVLADEQSLIGAVHEVYRWVRRGARVVAVVSAFAGETARLLERAHAVCERGDEASIAALCANGEMTSAPLLALALQRAGLTCEVRDAASIGLKTEGPVLDSTPVDVDEGAVLAALERAPVVVVPGFLGRDAGGRTTLLGRGGSDLTAIFLAGRLRGQRSVRCRLVKDVAGVFERDPQGAGGPGRRYERVRWGTVRGVGGRVLQSKAATYAETRGVLCEVAAAGRAACTRIDAAGEERFAVDETVKGPLRVVLLGLGVVGGGVFELLRREGEKFEVVGVAVRDVEKAVRAGVPAALVTGDAGACVERGCDVVVEVMGGVDPAAGLVERAISKGVDVVTANKAVIALRGEELERRAGERGVRLLYSAAVGGGLPMIEEVARLAAERGVRSLHAIVNATCNFVLSRVSAGAGFDEAVREAQRAGFAEANPSRDLEGLDAEDKVRILARAAFGERAAALRLTRRGVTERRVRELLERNPGRSVRHVASVRLDDAGGVVADLDLAVLDPAHALGAVRDEGNCLLITCADGGVEVVQGRGAGRWPTAESVFADLMDLWRLRRCGGERPAGCVGAWSQEGVKGTAAAEVGGAL